jgi:carboxypeptidase family protein/TonB-dependent receptor-like protein
MIASYNAVMKGAKMFARRFIYSTLILMLLLASASGFAQVVTGTIAGRVTDATGAVVPGASVQVQNTETGLFRSIQTDSGGRYEARNLPPGSYTVTAQQAGFRTEVRRGTTLTVGSEVAVNMELTVGEVQEKIQVTEEAPAIETTSATLSGLVSQQQIRDLPLNGRSYDQLALLSPGVLYQPNGTRNQTQGSGLRLTANGARTDANLYLLDGTTVNDHSSQGPGSAAGMSLGVEAIREFRVLTHNFSAEYGRNAGAIISAVTRSGTNEFHGNAYEFLRNNVLDARGFFNPGSLPPFRQNQFGASFGGRLIKDRIFFFANYEGFRQRQGVTSIATVPDLIARKGLLPNAAGVLTPVTLSPAVVPYLNLYPLPNGRNLGGGAAEFISDISTAATENYAMERMDFRLSDNDSFYWRYVFDPSEGFLPRPIPTWRDTSTGTNHFVVLSETHLFSPAMLNEFRFAFNRTTPGTISGPTDIQNHALDFIPGAGFGNLTFSSRGEGQATISELGTSRANPQIFPQNVFQATDTLSYMRGPHTWKFGFNLERIQLNTNSLKPRRGQYTFGSIDSLLAAAPSQGEFAFEFGDSSAYRGYRQILFGWFVQDDYRVRPNLTLNLGLRHEFINTPSEVNGRVANLRNITDAQSTLGPPFITTKLNFAPRAGLAWDPTGTGKTSVRVGGGIFYNQHVGRPWYTYAGGDYRFLTDYKVRNPPNFPNALRSGFAPGSNATSTVQYQADTPTMIHYNLEIQQQLASSISVHAGYVGSRGYHFPRPTEQDTRIPQILANGVKYFPLTAPFVNPNFSSITEMATDSGSNYNALQAGINKSFSRGLLFQANYTWGKSLSDADILSPSQILSTAGTSMDAADRNLDYGRSGFDRRHMFVFNSRYKLPLDNFLKPTWAKKALGGWEVNGIVQAGSGFAVDLRDGFNQSQNGDTGLPDRPNLVAGASNDPHSGTTAGCQGVAAGQKLGTPDRYYDACAFVLPPAGFYGNLARNTLTGPAFRSVDFAMEKNLPVKDRLNLIFRAEFFNLFNHANFAAPNNTVFSSSGLRNGSAGRITGTTTSNRQIQFSLKLTF